MSSLLTGSSTSKWIFYGSAAGIGCGIFSTYFPFVADFTGGRIAPQIYRNAWYQYDERLFFDNTAWTYATDYLIAIAMAVWAVSIGSQRKTEETATQQHTEDHALWRAHVLCSRGLLLSYAISVFSGAIAHQFFLSRDDLNTIAFRLIWTVCVGSVTAAAGWMGSIASVWAQRDENQGVGLIPVLPMLFWAAFCAIGTAVVAAGGWSYQRPACDIFVAGITQFPSTFYVMCLLYKGMPTLNGLTTNFRIGGMLAFILNAILLPAYPWLVDTNMSAGQVNCLLHCWLLLSWSSQAFTLRGVAKSLERSLLAPELAVPVMRNKTKAH